MGEHTFSRGVGKGNCKSCKAEIIFAASSTTKKLMPFQPDPQGRWAIENGTARYLGEAPAPTAQLELAAEPQPQRYTSHFAVCPDAGTYRKSGREVDRG